MKRLHIFTLLTAAALTGSAQSAVDAYSLAQRDLKGTARFMSMAGAFGALGGDISTLNQNPGGIGVYRNSDVGVTVDFDFQGTKTSPWSVPTDKYSSNQTKVYCNNFGYVGSVNLGSDVMPFFNWGASYSRVVSYDRLYGGNLPTLNGSLTNYVADFTSAEGWIPSQLYAGEQKYNPYADSWAPWSSILFYNTYLINPKGGGYTGLYNGTAGEGKFTVREQGHVDEYSINFGGNIQNTVYWGIGFGITDLDFRSNVYYEENYRSANIPNGDADGVINGWGGYGMDSKKHIYGTGFNFKAGVIVKPINELRLGLAIHTPTWYNLQQEGLTSVDFEMQSGYPTKNYDWSLAKTDYGYNDVFQWRTRTPWRLIASAAGVVGGRFIISGDYEYRPYQNIHISDGAGNDGDGDPKNPYTMLNEDISTYYKACNIVRLGAEFRVTPQVSVRAGYSYESSPVTVQTKENNEMVYTSGPDDTEVSPSYSLDNGTQYITCGLGYRYKGFYVDAAYVHKNRRSTFHGYTPVASDGSYTHAPVSDVVDNNNSLVLTLGFRF